ncbi:Lrp/AsnC ligand binding domain-containing protein [Ectothiorhodospiraceae bacterium WFHF3C12]|nr:Lrp/AsnC ligand binding domain-containing protein [Ectothiorhodospiraceae bacterium WFHF3C12]
MVTSIVLLNVERHRVNAAAEALAAMPEISEVFSVSGNYDLVAIARVRSNEDLSRLVTDKFLQVDGIEHTETMLAFKAYSRHDLESMFSI